MRQLVLPQIRLRSKSLPHAFESVFGPRMLRRVHGTSLKVGPFENGVRTFQFRVDVADVPPPIRPFFSGDHLNVTTRQTLEKQDAKWLVKNKLKMHFVGAELFGMKPTFWIEETPEGLFLGGTVRHDAVLPPPLNSIAERFMMVNSEKELRHFGECLAEAGVLELKSDDMA